MNCGKWLGFAVRIESIKYSVASLIVVVGSPKLPYDFQSIQEHHDSQRDTGKRSNSIVRDMAESLDVVKDRSQAQRYSQAQQYQEKDHHSFPEQTKASFRTVLSQIHCSVCCAVRAKSIVQWSAGWGAGAPGKRGGRLRCNATTILAVLGAE